MPRHRGHVLQYLYFPFAPRCVVAFSCFLLLAGCGSDHGDSIVASWRDGQLKHSDYVAWLSYMERLDTPTAIDDTVLSLHLEASALANGGADLPALKVEIADRRHRIYGNALRDHVIANVSVSQDEIDALFDQHPTAFQRPRKLKLRHIYIKTSDRADDTRAHLEGLLERLKKGEDFQEMARQESQSQTRFSGGNLGFVELSELPAPVRVAVQDLNEGELSEIVVQRDGLAVFLCEKVKDAKRPSQSEVKEKIRVNLVRRQSKADWQQTVSRLRQSIALANPLEPIDGVYRLGKAQLSTDEFAVLIANKAGVSNPRSVPANHVAVIARNWALGDAMVREAKRLGLDRESAFQDRLTWSRSEILAAFETERLITERYIDPEQGEVRAYFEANPKRFRSKEMVRMSAIFFGSDDEGANIVRQAEAVSDRIVKGRLGFAEAARQYSKHNSASSGGDLGWLDIVGLSKLGPDVTRAAKHLEPGQRTGLFRLESGLWLFQMVARRDAQPLSFDQVEKSAQAGAAALRRQETWLAIRNELLEDLSIQVHERASDL